MSWFDDVVSYVSDGVNDVYNYISDSAGYAYDSITSSLDNIFSIPENSVSGSINDLTSWIDNTYTSISDSVTSSFPSLSQSVTDIAGDISNSINNDVMWINNEGNAAINAIKNGYDIDWSRILLPEGIKPPQSNIEPAKPSLIEKIPIVGDLANSTKTGLENIYNSITGIPASVSERFFTQLYDQVTKEVDIPVSQIDKMLDDFPEYKALVQSMGLKTKRESPVLIIIGIVVGFAALQSIMKPFVRETDYIANQFLPNTIPSVSDLVTMETREVWRPQFRQKLLYQGNTHDYLRRMRQNGYDTETAQDYWRAHWQLPALGQGFEMFHRLRPGKVSPNLVFTEDDIITLLRIQDVLPDYHDKLVAIAYEPITRIDIRRMWQIGAITDKQELIDRHLDLGYSPADASSLADFVELDVQTEAQEAGSIKIVSDYQDTLITRDEAVAGLQALGMSPNRIEITLKSSDKILDKLREKKLKDEQKASIKKISNLSKSELKTLYSNRLISSEEYINGLIKLNVTPDNAALIVKNTDIELSKSAATKGKTTTTS